MLTYFIELPDDFVTRKYKRDAKRDAQMPHAVRVRIIDIVLNEGKHNQTKTGHSHSWYNPQELSFVWVYSPVFIRL